MKKQGILNSELSRIVARLGHTDRLVVCDAGLPIPHSATYVDLALTKNIPRFLDTLKVILEEMEVDEAFVAEELERMNRPTYDGVTSLLPGVKTTSVSHEEFKRLTRDNGNVFFVRTGEATPYANIILVSGVDFD
jgi:D-ribose pyranase